MPPGHRPRLVPLSRVRTRVRLPVALGLVLALAVLLGGGSVLAHAGTTSVTSVPATALQNGSAAQAAQAEESALLDGTAAQGATVAQDATAAQTSAAAQGSRAAQASAAAQTSTVAQASTATQAAAVTQAATVARGAAAAELTSPSSALASAPRFQTSAPAQQTQQTQQTEPSSAPAFSGAAAKLQNEALGEQIGSRPAGSANYDRAVQYAADQLRQWGYVPMLQSFPVDTYDDRGSRLQITAGPGTGDQLVADTLVYSIGGQIEAPLVAAGQGSPEDLAAVDVRGKLALIKRGTLRFGDKVANAASAGAAGVVVYNDVAGRLQGGSLGTSQPIPAAAISNADGQRLADQLAAGNALTVSLTVDASVLHGSSTNVVAQLPGTQPSAGNVVIGAHLDSVAAGPGANDDGSGSAVLLELAHTLAQSPGGGASLAADGSVLPGGAARPYGVTFVLFGAEELGLYGSRYYVENLSDAERHAVVAMINLDMVGVGQAWRFGGNDDLVQNALGAANDLGERALPLRGPLSQASDHASFMSAGIPALFLYRTDDPNYHTANDRSEFVDPNILDQAGTIVLRVMDVLSAQASAPTQ